MSSDSSDMLFYGAAWYVVFLFSTTLHEASHAFAALKMGDDTAHRGGQVSLDPLPHIRREPFGMVIIPILSFIMSGWMMGWASAPYDPEWAHRHPRRAGLMALAGPAANLSLCVLAVILIRIGVGAGWFSPPSHIRDITKIVEANGAGLPEFGAILLSIFFYLNLILFVFNLLPVPPLDGSSIPLICLPDSAAAQYTAFMRLPGVSLLGLVAAWQLFGYIGPYLYHWGLQWIYPGVSYN